MKPDAVDLTKDEREGGTVLGMVLTLLVILAYFGFIGLGAFAPAVLARPVVAGGTTTTMPLAFAVCWIVSVLDRGPRAALDRGNSEGQLRQSLRMPAVSA